MKERLQKLIAAAGLCSRRTAEEWIIQGKVTVDGDLARLGDTADPERNEILVEGRPLPAAPAKTTTVLLNKPRGVVTTLSDEKGRPTVARLLPPELGRLYPVGRLDQFSEGLLLMTNDGELANRLTHPAGEVRKTYRLWVSGWHEEALALLRRPIELDGYRIKPPEVRLVWVRQATGNRQQATGDAPVRSGEHCSPQEPRSDEATGQGIGNRESGIGDAGTGPSTPLRSAQDDGSETRAHIATALLEITIHEGRNRQIRRMAQAAGLTPTRLQRVAEGPITLGDLKPGQWRELSEAELRELRIEN
ncbi:MAG: rRNA pseudouridine synthase [Oscillospiraceae bacterium]|nr:rRNA pseudouridine synthase [Oscillospiraceae bacterium]